MQALPEYSDIVETNSGRATETSKLMYYNSENINYWYDEMIKVLCDELKIAKRTTGEDTTAEIVWTGNRYRMLCTDETAVKDRMEAARVSKKFMKRITRCMCVLVINLQFIYLICTHTHYRAFNLLKGRRRRYAKDKRCSVHETGSMGYSLAKEIVPPVWVINRKTVDATIRYVVYAPNFYMYPFNHSQPLTHPLPHNYISQEINAGCIAGLPHVL